MFDVINITYAAIRIWLKRFCSIFSFWTLLQNFGSIIMSNKQNNLLKIFRVKIVLICIIKFQLVIIYNISPFLNFTSLSIFN